VGLSNWTKYIPKSPCTLSSRWTFFSSNSSPRKPPKQITNSSGLWFPYLHPKMAWKFLPNGRIRRSSKTNLHTWNTSELEGTLVSGLGSFRTPVRNAFNSFDIHSLCLRPRFWVISYYCITDLTAVSFEYRHSGVVSFIHSHRLRITLHLMEDGF